MIVGAGLAGLITAHVFPGRPIVDCAAGPAAIHKALLRFRTDAIGELTGIPFKAVSVQKAIWSGGEFVRPSIRTTNMYSAKVIGRVDDSRSITNTATVTRFVAPDDFYERLVDAVGHRIQWNTTADFTQGGGLINTSPLPGVLKQLGIEAEHPFKWSHIEVARVKVKGASAYQTVYFPDPDTTLYRASLTGDILIAEFAGPVDQRWLEICGDVFGLYDQDYEVIGETKQSWGKIDPLPAAYRRELLHTLTEKHGIYSVGRFATYRNVLLDDVLNDALVVKRMINTDSYTRKLQGNPQ